MAVVTKTITNLPASTSVASTDVFVKETSGGVTEKITGENLASQVKGKIFSSITIEGTTSNTGAIAIPSNYWNSTFVAGLLNNNMIGFVVRRDGGYLTVCQNDLSGPMANTSVSINAVFIV